MSAASSSEQTAPDAPGAARPARGPRPGAGSIHVGELISAVSALALLVILFATEWYGVAGVPDPSAARPALSGVESGWNGLPVVRWVILLTVLVAVGSVILHASQRGHGNRTETGLAVFALGVLTSLLLIYRVLITLPSSEKVLDQKLGAVLGLAFALGIALGGHESLVELRDRRRATPRVRHRVRAPAPGAAAATAPGPDTATPDTAAPVAPAHGP